MLKNFRHLLWKSLADLNLCEGIAKQDCRSQSTPSIIQIISSGDKYKIFAKHPQEESKTKGKEISNS